MSTLIDTYGRTLDNLRISVTDRCNFRCKYCMPPEGAPTLPKASWLSFAQIVRVARVFVRLGGRAIRLTGGEPLLRKNLSTLVQQLAVLPGLADLSLTTNGYLLAKQAAALREAGLHRINISLDSLDPKRFTQLTRSPHFQTVWQGIEASLRLGFQTKVNVVVMQGMTCDEILAFGELAATAAVEVRFIEFMPLCGTGWHPEWMLPLSEVRSCLENHYQLTSVPRGSHAAQSYHINGGAGRVGFIASMTEPFCRDCSRLRLTADGALRPCLFSHAAIDLRDALRDDANDAGLEACFRRAVVKKPAGHGITLPVRDAQQFPSIRFVGG